MLTRNEIKKSKRIVIKIGSSIVTDENEVIDERFLNHLAEQINFLQSKGKEIIIVSSGAVASGMMVLKIKEKPKSISEKQALAAFGQGYLIAKYNEFFSKFGMLIAQVLLTSEDIADRKRYLNAKNTLETLISKKIIPIINENDTVATSEIRLGDNDNLSAEVACLLEADLLIILSDVEGFYEDDPRKRKSVKIIDTVTDVGKYIEKVSNLSGSKVGTGGIYTKLQAAKKVMLMGIPCVLAKGKMENVILKILKGEKIGTFFVPLEKKISHKKYFIAFNVKPKGKIIIDDGAKEALIKRGKSLLPSGVIKTVGNFDVGDVVEIEDKKNNKIARGLVNYSAVEVEKIKGAKSSEIEKKLGYKYEDEVIHRNNLVLI
ncbi:MAG: glutamate 5-kinase [Proteobacteria bacterium]|nr:glutamate 5-kinase [Pseudomonadota bacterium]